MTKVELFEAIRRDKHLHGKSIRQIAQERHVHRRTVRQALDSAIPRPRKPLERTSVVFTPQMQGLVDDWLLADRTAPRKQRHTARRIYQRLRQELGYQGSESAVRRYVGRRRREIGLSHQAFVPLTHMPAAEAEVDWFEVEVDLPTGRQTVHLFMMRACFSGREFVMAFPRQTQQAFLEAHVAAFAYFGGVFLTVRYDNLASAVHKVLRGRKRVETDRFVALRSHYLFGAEFCRPGVEGAHEKGGVEGGGGRFRRHHLVPVPKVDTLDELNATLLDACARDDQRVIEGRAVSILDDWARERTLLRPLPGEPLDAAEVGVVRIDARGCATVRTNRYSVPIGLTGRRVEYRLHARTVEFVHDGRVIATHPRLQSRHELRVELDHYLELLWHKPGALHSSLPLRQARERGQWPAVYDQFQQALAERFDPTEATRQMLAVMMLHREIAADAVHVAVELAIERGCFDAGAVAVLARQLTRAPEPAVTRLDDLGELARYERPVASLDDYDQLLTQRSSTQAVH